MSNQQWGGGVPPQGGNPQQGGYQQGGYPQDGYPQQPSQGYPQQPSQGYPQQGGYPQGGFPQQPTQTFGQQPQGYPPNPQQGGYPPGQMPPGGQAPTGYGGPGDGGNGGKSKLPLIIGAVALVVVVIGVAVFFLTRGNGETASPSASPSASQTTDQPTASGTPSETLPVPVPSLPEASDLPTAPTIPSVPGGEPGGEEATITAADLPASVGQWTVTDMFGMPVYSNSDFKVISVMSMGTALTPQLMERSLEGAQWMLNNTVVCGTATGDEMLQCYGSTTKFGTVVIAGDASAEDTRTVAEAVFTHLQQ